MDKARCHINICASCGLVQKLGFIQDGIITEKDTAPEVEFLHDKYERAFCTHECHEYWLGIQRKSRNAEIGAGQKAAINAGIMTAKLIGTLAIKPTRRLRKIIY